MPKYKITLEYDGTNFCGWQEQANKITIQGLLQEIILKITKESAVVFASGRTDSGVHAIGQVAHFTINNQKFTPFRMREAFNHYLWHSGVSVLDCELVDDKFHARFDSKARQYRYLIINRRPALSLMHNRAWHIIEKLDVAKMQQAAELLLGTHDFSSFRASECQASSPIKTIAEVSFKQEGELIYFTIKARSFLHHMVRNIVGTLKLIGVNKISLEEFQRILDAKDRSKAGITAPACGLYFERVWY